MEDGYGHGDGACEDFLTIFGVRGPRWKGDELEWNGILLWEEEGEGVVSRNGTGLDRTGPGRYHPTL